MTSHADATARQSLLALLGLLGVAAAWGLSFPLTKQALAEVSAFDLLAQRGALAAVVATAVLFRWARRLSRTAVLRGALLGALYGVAGLLQTEGLAHTSASVTGFITGMYVVLTPVCAVFLVKARILLVWWWGAGLATIGLGVMSLNGFSVGFGEALTLLSALLYALHIVGLGHWSRGENALGLAVVQLIVTALVNLVAATPGGITLVSSQDNVLVVIYLATASGAIALIVQSWAQAHIAASRAAVIMVTEPLWSAGLSIGFFHEPLTIRIAVGGGLMITAMLLVELAPRRSDDPPRAEELSSLSH